MIELVKVSKEHKEYFAKWWRDKYLISLTSGNHKEISDKKVDTYFSTMLNGKNRYDYMIKLDNKIIGHICLTKGKNNTYELQTIIGEKQNMGKGYGKQAIKLILDFAKQKHINNIYLYVRPENSRAINAYKAAGFIKQGGIIKTNNPNQPKLLLMIFKNM